MDDNIKKRIHHFENEKHDPQAELARERIWSRLDIHQTRNKQGKTYWPVFLALLLLLMLLGLINLWNRYNRTVQEYQSLKKDFEFAQSDLEKIKQLHTEQVNSEIVEHGFERPVKIEEDQSISGEVMVKERIVYVNNIQKVYDTIYVEQDPVIEYRERIVRDTVLIEVEPDKESEDAIMADVQNRGEDLPKAVYFDLRKAAPDKKEKGTGVVVRTSLKD